MSNISGIRGFSVNMYGQSGIVMDWFGLTDPFTQQLPLKITNTYSGSLWFQGALVYPGSGLSTSGYYNYSGIQMGSVNSGASNTLVMTWDRGVSGWVGTSSPVTDALLLNLTTYTSSNYTGSYSSGNFTFSNIYFNRWSGLIPVFGDIYNNDQPKPTVQVQNGGTMACNSGSTQAYSYAISYVMSGWESDIGAPTVATVANNSPSGTITRTVALSWTSILGASQYFVWRWSGSVDFTQYPSVSSGVLSPIDLINVATTNSYTDTNGSILSGGFYRHINWEVANNLATTNTTTYLSPPQSRQLFATGFWSHTYQLSKNISGTSLVGPFYMVFHMNTDRTPIQGLAIGTGIDGLISGTTIADASAMSGIIINTWYRHAVILGKSTTLSASGTVHMQIQTPNTNAVKVDDVYVVAVA